MIQYYNKGVREKTQDNVRKTMQMVLQLKKTEKIEKRGLTISLVSGILTKLFDGDEVQKVERV